MKPDHLNLLDAIERKELLSLTWGYVDGSMTRDEAIRLGVEVVDNEDDAENLLELLISKCLVFEIRGARIRSRFAEIVRLLTRLRQLFPGRSWESSPRLVSDFRVDIRQRSYPERSKSASQLAAEHSKVFDSSALRKLMWKALTESPQIRLAAFQERSTLRLLVPEPDTGTIITAGTGSGKTMAFYLPAFIRIGEHIKPEQYWVKALAIYPRTELLKDQLSEAFVRSRTIDPILKKFEKRKLLLGAYFGSTPNAATLEAIGAKWKKLHHGYICPWFLCPNCSSVLLWRETDISVGKERLCCENSSCGNVIDEDELVLTRTRLSQKPPDILFTTTEMLNQRMSDLRMRSLFGIGQPKDRRPLFALLDEVHTYIGTSGAQASLVLRRWRHLISNPVMWCGLSATLNEAPRFFSDLTGVPIDKVVQITPTFDEMIIEGAEYQIVVRGDPTLQASLLSTSIQASMLIGRMLDCPSDSKSDGAFGKRLFVFTDDLDVTNRLFDNLRDAEAYTIFGKPDPNRNPLAALRGMVNDDSERDIDGQRWRACEVIGRNLDERLNIGRTTSQDAGVMSNADVIVATAALEVGYNDEGVGAVLQHKSPRNMASFLQRKGRAGRKRGMRPITITALSDYGRDRVNFQAYEYLFDPTLPTQNLPILNQYVLRMQAVFSFIDWLAVQLSSVCNTGWLWQALSRPNNNLPGNFIAQIRQKLSLLVRSDVATIESLRAHLVQSLQVPVETIESIFWDPPRALLLEAIPTLVRRLFRNWKLAYPRPGIDNDFQVDYHPLPDFVPRTLFSDLCLPEVQILIPPPTVNDTVKQETLSIVQALQQLTPGRVTRRFAFERGGLSHWAPIDTEADEQDITIDGYSPQNEILGQFDGRRDNGDTVSITVYRPWAIPLSQARQETVSPTSNSTPIWYSGFVPRGSPLVIETPGKIAWREWVSGVNFFLHRFRSSISVRRFSPEAVATIRRRGGERLSKIRYVDKLGLPSSVGFEMEVDGFYMDFRLPTASELFNVKLSEELLRSSRLAYHRYRLLSSTNIPLEVSTLQREWLHQILLSASVSKALAENITIGTAAISLLNADPIHEFRTVMRSLFAKTEDWESEEYDEMDDDSSRETSGVSRLEERLVESLGTSAVINTLKDLAPELDLPDQTAFGDWLRHTLLETLSEALLQACVNSAPKHAATDTLISDLEIFNESNCGRVWITETSPGGTGVIQAFADSFSNEPGALFRALEAALAPADLELACLGLRRFIEVACFDKPIADLLDKVRNTVDHSLRDDLRSQLYEALSNHHVEVSHGLSVSINTRLLKLGTSRGSDELLFQLISAWESYESRCNIAIGLREFCFVALKDSSIKHRVKAILKVADDRSSGDYELIQSLSCALWSRGIEVRQRALQSYNPYRRSRITDPSLVRALLLSPQVAPVNIADENWMKSLIENLAEYGTADLIATIDNERKLRSVIIQIIGTPIDVGYLQFFPAVERLARGDLVTILTVSLREQM